MFTIKFRKSRSKNYTIVEKLARNFDDHSFENDMHVIHISVKELFEKWDFFKLMFWRSIDWVGSSFGYDGYDLHGHEDKTRIFYALQSAHVSWICLSEDYISRIAPIYFDKSLDEKLRRIIFNEKDTDQLMDLLLAEKKREEFQKEYGTLNDK